MLLGLSAFSMAEGMKDGMYTETFGGMHGEMQAEMVVKDGKIESIKVLSHNETPGVGNIPLEVLPARIVEAQSLAVDTVTGATVTSYAFLAGVEKLLKQAGADVKAMKEKKEVKPEEKLVVDSEVVVVGGGGAGLSAAVKAAQNGVKVVLIEKTGFLGGNSIVSGGIYNAPDPAMQDNAEFKGNLTAAVEAALAEEAISEEHKALQEVVRKEYEEFKTSGKKVYDSANWFALQTWNGGDKAANLDMVKLFASSAFAGLEWLKGMGMEFRPEISFGAGSLYLRTHGAVMPNGTGYIDTLYKEAQKHENLSILMETTGKSLIVKDGRVVGVNAVARHGGEVVLNASKGVILTTGGFAGNVELRQQYCEGEKWPNLGKSVPTSNVSGVTGDGIFMARDAGAALVNMDSIQLLPYCHPQTGATYDICYPSMTGIFVNREGKRFVREDGRRDEMSKAIIDQTEGYMHIVFSADFLPDGDAKKGQMLGGHDLQYYLDNKLSGYVSGNTVEELAKAMDVPADALKATIDAFNAKFDKGETDEFGRQTYKFKLEKGPFFAYPRKPAVHHTMGGVNIDEGARALDKDGKPIPGLYCAGEITGNLHGLNRLGGNAIVDFVVFGRIAGDAVVNDNK